MAGKNNIHTLSVDSSTKHLAEVRDFVAAHAKNVGLSEKDISEIRLAVDEAFTNIIKHAYKNTTSKPVKIELGFDPSKLWISIMDEGEGFKPDEYKAPDILKRIKNKQRGGMGVFLIQKLMDQVQYNRKGQMNEIRMVKNL
ncbi:MAG: ATP-binding protein [Balneolaceae bacterium]|nr:ATP-binding protein [Balneolaceae bacterium]MBO6545277.1 ATP-binding protein [Balneolaceae bacterium]MBO6646673.1 ATP-binding protein [Balneolaceae bacterium]